MSQKPAVTAFFDKRTFSVQYVAADPATGKCAIIDPVLDYDEKSGATSTENADAILKFVADNGLTVEWILDTHPHADHFSAARYLKEKTGAPTAIACFRPATGSRSAISTRRCCSRPAIRWPRSPM
jgi:glyoxylase-like metal-dependent hydrolase (beta-lactamase superfamily II)